MLRGNAMRYSSRLPSALRTSLHGITPKIHRWCHVIDTGSRRYMETVYEDGSIPDSKALMEGEAEHSAYVGNRRAFLYLCRLMRVAMKQITMYTVSEIIAPLLIMGRIDLLQAYIDRYSFELSKLPDSSRDYIMMCALCSCEPSTIRFLLYHGIYIDFRTIKYTLEYVRRKSNAFEEFHNMYYRIYPLLQSEFFAGDRVSQTALERLTEVCNNPDFFAVNKDRVLFSGSRMRW